LTVATAADLATIRQWCGSDVGADGDQFDLIDVDERLDRLSSANMVALEILRQRRADLVHAGKVDVDGDVSHDPKDSIAALDRDIGRLEAVIGIESGDGTVTTSLMVRRSERGCTTSWPTNRCR
jgi:hypothetical protein